MEEQEEKKEQKEPKPKGGHREGSGRKAKFGAPTQVVRARIRVDYLEIIKLRYKTPSDFIQSAVREKLMRERLIIK